MRGGVKQTAAPTITNASPRKRKRPRWQRSLIAACVAILLLVGGKLVDEALSRVAPQVLDHLPDFLNAIRTAPLWAQVIGLLGIGVLAFGVAWLILADRQQKQAEEAEQAEQDRTEQGKLLDAHVGGPITTAIREGFQEMKRQQPPALPARMSAPSGLPRAVAFVGREQMLSDLMVDLRAGGVVGVFALAGMGGVGKTALAAEAIARLVEERVFPAGAAWIACEDLSGPEGLAEAWKRVARALDAAGIAALPDVEQRRAALHALLMQSERLLLALDNVDSLEAGPLLETLAVQDHTTLLLTARQMINLPGLTPISLDTLSSAEAQPLFAQTLRRSSPRTPRPTPDDEKALPGLVADLGGLPLAIELTATYAGRQGLGLATVRQEIVADGVKAAPFLPAQQPQQRTLVRRFDRSWQALANTPHRQQFFASLSLLKGDSFPREAALALALKAGGMQATRASAAVDLAALIDYALVEALAGERYRLHPLLRDYAGKRLDTDHVAARDQLGEAMGAFWLDYARAHPGYEGMDALEIEAAGLMGALAWAREHAQYREIMGLVRAMDDFLFVRGRRDEARLVRPWAVEAALALNDMREERWATHELALLDFVTGRLSEARAGYERALELARQLEDQAAERREIHGLARIDADQGRIAEARVGFQRALELAQKLGDTTAEQLEVHKLARLDFVAGRLSEARVGYERALELARQLRDPVAERRELHGLARIDANEGRLAEARIGFEQAMALARRVGDMSAEGAELAYLGILIGQHGEPDQGRKLISKALAISERLGDIYDMGKAHWFLGWLDRDEGHRTEAITHFREVVRCFEQVLSPNVEVVRAELRALEENNDRA